MYNLGTNDERIKKLIKHKYDKNHVMVDDLFILSLEKCKKSKLKFCLICEELIHSNEAEMLLQYYKSHTECFLISKKIFDRITVKENTCGIILYTEIEQISLANLEKTKFIMICDALEISGNIGTIFRTAESVQVDALIFTNLRAKVFDDKVVHGSRGMIFCVPFIEMKFEDLCKFLNKTNYIPVVCEPEQGVDLKLFNYRQKAAFVVGSERYGSDKRWFDLKNTQYLKIPMYGIMDSLNVGVAASLILYEASYGKR